MNLKHIVSISLFLSVSSCYDFAIDKTDGGTNSGTSDSGAISTEGVGNSGALITNPGFVSSGMAGASGASDGRLGPAGFGSAGVGQQPAGAGSAAFGSAGASGGSETLFESCAIENTIRCSNSGVGQRELCQGGTWQPAEACATGEVCSSQSGEKQGTCQKLEAICQGSAGRPVCDGQGVMYLCNADATIESQETCLSARHCNAGLANGKCPACIPGEFKCTGSQLETCTTDGSGFVSMETCDTAALCNKSVGQCTAAVCVPNKFVCENDTLRKCNSDQTALVDVKPCGRGLCDDVAGECDICVPGEKKCEADTVATCDPKGQSYLRQSCSGNTKRCVGTGQCVACTQDNDCPDPGTCKERYCNTAQGICAPRNQDDHASCSGGICSSGACVECISNSDCANKSTAKTCNSARKCVECTTGSDCAAHDCADTSCSSGSCKSTAKRQQTASGDGTLVRGGDGSSSDPRFVVYGNALFYVSTPAELEALGGEQNVKKVSLTSYSKCPVAGTLVQEQGNNAVYVSDGSQLKWVKSPADLETYCGGRSKIKTVPTNSLTSPAFRPPNGTCPLNNN
jgi:hypothetical protein